MTSFTVYVTEPQVIKQSIVEATFGTVPHQLIAGSPDFTKGDPSNCNTVLIRSGTQIDASVMQKMPQLKHVVRVGVGLDNVDLDFCDQAGIAVYNAPGANADAVAEYAVAVILYALRKMHHLTQADQEQWNRFKFSGHGIASQTVGIVGFGNIGKLLYQKLSALGATDFIIYDPFVTAAPGNARLAPLNELIRDSTVISLHLPLIPATKHIINAKMLALMREDAVLLNAARGGIVDETALIAQLKTKAFTYIADTVEGEPHPNPGLLNNENIIITPHIASLTSDAEATMIRTAIENLIAGKQAPRLPK